MRKLLLMLVLSCLAISLHAEEKTQYAKASWDAPELKDRFSNLKFENFEVLLYKGKIANKVILTKEQKDNWHLVEEANEALKEVKKNRKTINFAGKYVVLLPSCGMVCQTAYILDVETGKVLDAPSHGPYPVRADGKNEDEVELDLQDAFWVGSDIVHKANSRLFLADGFGEYNTGSFAYEFRDGKFTLLKYLPIIKIKNGDE